jgi:hypothetical protein
LQDFLADNGNFGNNKNLEFAEFLLFIIFHTIINKNNLVIPKYFYCILKMEIKSRPLEMKKSLICGENLGKNY